jgi:hypothetical protein
MSVNWSGGPLLKKKKQRQKEKPKQAEHDLSSLPAIYIRGVVINKSTGKNNFNMTQTRKIEKNDTIGGSYSLAGSFFGRPVPINHLAGRASPVPLSHLV